MKYVKGLDVLRAIAVLFVIHEHWGPHSFRTSGLLNFLVQKIIPNGQFGVDLFFVLSGFLITGILLKAKNDQAHTSWTSILGNFIARRSLRIFPIYYLCICLLFMLDYPDVRKDIFYLATYTENFLVFKRNFWDAFCHTWSLAVEEQFYLIWPLIILLTPNKYIFPILIFFIAASTLSGFVTAYFYGPYSSVLPFNCFNAFAIGGLYAYSRTDTRISSKVRKIFTWALSAALVIYATLLWAIPDFPARIVNSVICINLIIYVVEARYGTVASSILHNKVLVKMGRVSYGIYLYHFFVPHYYYTILKYIEGKYQIPHQLQKFFGHPGIAEVIQFFILIAISLFSYYTIERMFLNLKKNFSYNHEYKKLDGVTG